MSRYILSERYALRSWNSLPCMLYEQGRELPFRVDEESFALLRKADGEELIEDSALLRELLAREFLRPASEGDKLSDWQKYRKIQNRLRPYLALEMTERCNYRCRHCFNAEDNSVPRCELSLKEIAELLDACVECGIQNVLLTGGEPLVHPDFHGVVEEIARRGMNLYELNTNGALLEEKTLALLKACSFHPQIKISFDGLGFHDWMRGVEGAEEKTLDAMALCVRQGFDVRAQMNLNRKNRDTILPSLRKLCELGVEDCRIIRTTEAPRWELNGDGEVLTWEEYYDASLSIARSASEENLPLKLNFWQFLTLNIPERTFASDCVRYKAGSFNLRRPQCSTVRGMPAVGADGELYPCLQMSGFMKLKGVKLGNVRERPLSELLKKSAYSEFADRDVAGKIAVTGECFLCPYLPYCAGGCPAVSQLTSGDFLGKDEAKCLFFYNGWMEKLEEAFPGWENLMPLA